MRTSELDNIFLPDSWVLSVESTETSVIFVLDAVLEQGHPRFYWPPKPGEQYPYTRVAWRIEGDIHWNEGPNLNLPLSVPTGNGTTGTSIRGLHRQMAAGRRWRANGAAS